MPTAIIVTGIYYFFKKNLTSDKFRSDPGKLSQVA